MTRSVAILVKGKVQGVFFRQSTREIAQQLDISGTVMNNSDGTVFITASGDAGRIEQLISWCRKGPSRAVVSDVEVRDIPEFSAETFRIQ
jgi:acylphosphatase